MNKRMIKKIKNALAKNQYELRICRPHCTIFKTEKGFELNDDSMVGDIYLDSDKFPTIVFDVYDSFAFCFTDDAREPNEKIDLPELDKIKDRIIHNELRNEFDSELNLDWHTTRKKEVEFFCRDYEKQIAEQIKDIKKLKFTEFDSDIFNRVYSVKGIHGLQIECEAVTLYSHYLEREILEKINTEQFIYIENEVGKPFDVVTSGVYIEKVDEQIIDFFAKTYKKEMNLI